MLALHRHRPRLRARTVFLLLAALCATGCSLTRPPAEDSQAGAIAQSETLPLADVDHPGKRLLGFAEQFVGAPYLYGGSTSQGFDCSGLVFRAHVLAGISSVPRSAFEQHAAASPVPKSALQPGDLVFFASRRGRVDHVGLYAGDGRFLHAPRTGRPVGYDRLDDGWFATRFVGAGRFWIPPRDGESVREDPESAPGR